MAEGQAPETEDTEAGQSASVTDRPRKPHHGPWFYLRATMLVGILAPVLFGIVAMFLIVGREVDAPSWVVARIEAEAEAALGGGTLNFGRMTVTLGRDLHPRVALVQADLRDAEGAPIARVPRIELLVSPRGLVLRRKVLVQEVRLTGAQIALRRASDGSVALAFESSGSSVREAASLVALLDEMDRALEAPALKALEQLTADGLIVNFADARAGRSWTVDGGQIDLDLRGGMTALRGELSLLSGRSYVTGLVLSYESPRGSREAQMGVTITDGAAADLGTQAAALSWLAALDAPLTASLRANLDSAGALGPVNASLEIGPGDLRPTEATRPIPFDTAKTYLTYDPSTAEVRFDRLEVQSDWGGFNAEGRSYLRELEAGWPEALIGQFEFSNILLNPEDLFPEPRRIDSASADFRLRLSPFSVEVGQFQVSGGDHVLLGSGRINAAEAGWEVSTDIKAEAVTPEFVLSLWPETVRSPTRTWFTTNLISSRLHNLVFGIRWFADRPMQVAGSVEYRDTSLRYIETLPALTGAEGQMTLDGTTFTAVVEAGTVLAPQGGQIDLAGSVFAIPDITRQYAPAVVDLTMEGTVTAALSILDEPPFQFMSTAGLAVDMADGRARTVGRLELPLKPNVGVDEVIFVADAVISDVQSDVLVPDRTLAASRLTLHADNEGILVGGPLRVGAARMNGTWGRALGPDTGGRSQVEASVTLDTEFLREFNIGLPEGTVRGSAEASLTIDLITGEEPSFLLRSDLQGAALQLPAVGWSKAGAEAGALEVTGRLGPTASIDRLALDAGGLKAAGTVSLSEGGGLDRAEFERVQLGGWLDAPVTLRGRGARAAVGIEITGGDFDLRRAEFGDSGGQGGPMSVALDRVQISDGIALTDFRGEFDASGGFSGQFTGLINGRTSVRGTIVPRADRSAVRIVSNDAGGVFRSAGLLENAHGGSFEMVLLPTGAEGNYDGTLAATDLRVRDAPALASLLDAISVVGLLQQMDGQGLAFANVDAKFRLTPDRIIVTQGSAVGPGLGISMDGIYTLASKQMEFQGVISPLYLLNSIGSVLTRPGEGLFGFSYTLSGQVGDLRVVVNPLSALTPGMFREIFRRPPPQAN